jgi:hypothetical protein
LLILYNKSHTSFWLKITLIYYTIDKVLRHCVFIFDIA